MPCEKQGKKRCNFSTLIIINKGRISPTGFQLKKRTPLTELKMKGVVRTVFPHVDHVESCTGAVAHIEGSHTPCSTPNSAGPWRTGLQVQEDLIHAPQRSPSATGSAATTVLVWGHSGCQWGREEMKMHDEAQLTKIRYLTLYNVLPQ